VSPRIVRLGGSMINVLSAIILTAIRVIYFVQPAIKIQHLNRFLQVASMESQQQSYK
jgi:hypothetical protein